MAASDLAALVSSCPAGQQHTCRTDRSQPRARIIRLMAMDLRAALGGDRHVIDAWARHVAGAALVVAAVLFLFEIPFWLYLFVPCWIGQSLIAIRTYAEHRWHEAPEGRTIIVEKSLLSLLFLNNNLHVVHHKMPAAPWYRLPQLFAERRASGSRSTRVMCSRIILPCSRLGPSNRRSRLCIRFCGKNNNDSWEIAGC